MSTQCTGKKMISAEKALQTAPPRRGFGFTDNDSCISFIFSNDDDHHHNTLNNNNNNHKKSNWLDAAILLASFHYQCAQYDTLRPLTFGANPKIRNETREREHLHEMSLSALEKIIEKAEGPKPQLTGDLRQGARFWKRMFLLRPRRQRRSQPPSPPPQQQQQDHPGANHFPHHAPHPSPRNGGSVTDPQPKDSKRSSKTFKPNRSVTFEARNHFTLGPQQNCLHQSRSGISVHGGAGYQPPPTRSDSLRSEWRASFVAEKAKGHQGHAQSARLLRMIGLDTPTPSLFLQGRSTFFQSACY
jgi:hypothetical protein